jgi:hypothetical protein
MMSIREIEGINLDKDLREFRLDPKFVAYTDPRNPGDLMTYPQAVREAAGMGGNACVGYVVDDEPVPAPTKRKRK